MAEPCARIGDQCYPHRHPWPCPQPVAPEHGNRRYSDADLLAALPGTTAEVGRRLGRAANTVKYRLGRLAAEGRVVRKQRIKGRPGCPVVWEPAGGVREPGTDVWWRP